MTSLLQLPADLPAPRDDGAADHLPCLHLPDLVLPASDATQVALARFTGRIVIYCYPMTGRPDVPLPEGWDMIPGARGCTPEACAFRDHYSELRAAGVHAVYGLSTQASMFQHEAAQRLHLPFLLLSDADLAVQSALRLPTFVGAGMTLLKRLTLVVDAGKITHVFYPVFPPDTHAAQVVAWLESHPLCG
ncbi:MAG: peroxiredoxin [Chloroflexaceae bacterium]|nr:peroxiredoxin [Chloroflexaceae bacterium]